MSDVVSVKLIQEHLMVGRALRVRAGKSETYGEFNGMYLYEGKVYMLPIAADKFNACRDEVRKTYRNKDTIFITLGQHLAGHQLTNWWDIYGAEDGWRVEFKYDKTTDKVTYTQPGKSHHTAEADSVMVIEPCTEPARLPVEPPLDPALSAADEDFPLTMGASHHNPKAAQEALAKLIHGTSLGRKEPFTVQVDGTVTINSGCVGKGVVENLQVVEQVDPLAAEAEKFPAYWKPLPANWKFIDTYRVDVLFPLNDSRLTHARKKLLVCGTRTGGKSVRKDIAEAYATLGQWLIENPEV